MLAGVPNCARVFLLRKESGQLLKDTLNAFDNFKNKQKSVWSNVFLIYKSMYILKVYSIHTLYIGIKHKC